MLRWQFLLKILHALTKNLNNSFEEICQYFSEKLPKSQKIVAITLTPSRPIFHRLVFVSGAFDETSEFSGRLLPEPEQSADAGSVATDRVDDPETVRQSGRRGQRPGAYTTKSYKYWFTNICNYNYL
jgi:hypothetical protein